MRVLNILRKYKRYFQDADKSLLRIEISSANLLHNINQFRSRYSKHKIAAVLKSNAYGHGLKEVGSFLDKNKDISYFAVDSLLEAQILRDHGVKKPIIIIGYVSDKAFSDLARLKSVTVVITSLEQARIFQEKINFSLSIHLKVDTGLRRHGIMLDELEEAIGMILRNKNLKTEGLMTHLADAGSADSKITLEQLDVWKKSVAIFRKYFSGGLLHFAATAGTRYLDRAESNLIRIGIGLWGFGNREDLDLDLKPVLSWKAKIVNIKELKAGEGAGYNFLFRAEKDLKIAVIPCGYYEGVPRVLTNKGFVYYENTPLRMIGRISMNLTIIDITDVYGHIKLEDEVTVISVDSQKLNSVFHYAKLAGRTSYEILVALAPTIRRVVI